MAASAQQAPVPPPDVVGNAFVHQYYLILHQSPELVHRFYQDDSKLGRTEEGGIMSTTTTMQAINEKILSLGCGDFRAEITTVDSQESYNGGVLVLVTGYLTGSDNNRQKFTQSFFLAPQDNGYFVLNDVFRFVDDAKHQNGNLEVISSVEAPPTPNQEFSSVNENHISEQTTAFSEEANVEEVCDPSEDGDGAIEEEEAPVPEIVDEVPDDSHMVVDSQTVAEPNAKIEEVPKKSYASILKVMKENAAPFSSPAPSPVRSAPKSQEQVTAAVPPALATETHVFTSNTTENGNVQENEAEGPSIYVKGLPLDATPVLLEDEFKKFGPIRSGGIQVRCQKGFCFGFVEFEVASAVQSALQASPIMISGCRVVVEEKRSTSRGNNRGRFSSGAGAGYRNEGPRGGGYSNRGGDGYRRNDKMRNNGDRANRAGGLSLNAAAKTTAPRVSATA
ncbi:hypothetical protein MANES_12G047900v8 [Manihot esculenta]|uniref:Uncharacterized protein n=1 Tax=Manihot esculenta TaxID=3983 RepID=A0ACB7GPT9_MANES|nr:hypothetical protein MANES_12G047900v8 [Manihot esculenta]